LFDALIRANNLFEGGTPNLFGPPGSPSAPFSRRTPFRRTMTRL